MQSQESDIIHTMLRSFLLSNQPSNPHLATVPSSQSIFQSITSVGCLKNAPGLLVIAINIDHMLFRRSIIISFASWLSVSDENIYTRESYALL